MRVNFLSSISFQQVIPSSIPRLCGRLVLLTLCALPCTAYPFGFDDVAKTAKGLAAAAYVKPANNLPEDIKNLNFEQYQGIRFNAEKSPWRNAKLPFELGFIHQGSVYDYPVRINEIDDKKVRQIKFDPAMFNYNGIKVDQNKLRDLGFAGFRVQYPVNSSKVQDEVLVFLGASYFRAIGKGQGYGLSARGLAVDTALDSGEEFPRFVEFWIRRPTESDKELTIYALLDSRRVTGAYRFILKPGVDTAVDVKAQLYLRENVAKFGFAPLTSMYFFGENQRSAIEDFRPEMHDSDGLSIQSSTGEWIWRPLVNPKRLLVTSYALTNPLGFGLMQRDRAFSSYEDLGSRYELRPSAWVEPKGNWGAGRVELVQIPSPDENNDNIVAFWVPDIAPRVGQPYNIEYQLLWQKENEKRPPRSWATQTRRSQRFQGKPDGSVVLLVDFEGPALKKLAADAKVEGTVSTDANGKVQSANVYRNAATGGWRMVMRIRRADAGKPVELRAFLHDASDTLSETWSYLLIPD